MRTIKIIIILFVTFHSLPLFSNELSFDDWLKNFKIYALKNDISEETFDKSMSHVVFLPKVIKYDRFQPDFMKILKHIFQKEQIKKNKRRFKII